MRGKQVVYGIIASAAIWKMVVEEYRGISKRFLIKYRRFHERLIGSKVSR